MADEDRKPCGEYHPLPCGLDERCPVPLAFHEVELDDAAVVAAWEDSE